MQYARNVEVVVRTGLAVTTTTGISLVVALAATSWRTTRPLRSGKPIVAMMVDRVSKNYGREDMS